MTLAHRPRRIGAAAGLGPTAAIGAWLSMGLLAAVTMGAGWIAGPLAVNIPRSFAKATIAYAIAVIVTTTALSVVQAAADTITSGDISIGGLAVAVVGRSLIGVAGIAYLILPALAFGALWVVVARGISRAVSRHPAIRSSGSE